MIGEDASCYGERGRKGGRKGIGVLAYLTTAGSMWKAAVRVVSSARKFEWRSLRGDYRWGGRRPFWIVVWRMVWGEVGAGR